MLLAAEFANLRSDDGYVEALRSAYLAINAEIFDIEVLRRTLLRVIAHLHRRHRFGQESQVVRSGIDMVINLLCVDPTPTSINLLVEFLEALADEGFDFRFLQG